MKKILVIDDESNQRRVVAMALQSCGFETLEAADGVEGLSLARTETPDLILSDVNMDRMGGLELLQQLRSNADTAAIQVILMTGEVEANGMRQSMELGADDFFPKPFEPATLLAGVQMRLGRREAMEKEMRKVQSRLLSMLAATPNFVALADTATGRFAYLNAAGRSMLGCEAPEDITRLAAVRKHGGTVTFETEVGVGTTFTVRLPLVASSSSAPASPVAVATP